MATLKKIKDEIRFLSLLKEVTFIYQEMANFQMRKIQKEVLTTRRFLEQIREVYHHVMMSFYGETKEEISFLEKNKKSIALFLSANERFYGPLIFYIWQKLLKELKKYDEVAIAGQIGRQLALHQKTKEKFFYFELEDEKPKRERIETIFNFIKKYQKIVIFHGKFQTIATQIPEKTEISLTFLPEKEFSSREKRKYYILEPSPREILEFFETQIMKAFFNQVISEHQLAKFASRMLAMYRANENLKKNIRILEKKSKSLGKIVQNKKQLELLSIFKIQKI